MSTITIHLRNKEEETLMENLLKRMKISFEKNEDDFELTDEMKRVIDEALKQGRSQSVDAFECNLNLQQKTLGRNYLMLISLYR